jgi:putative transposase
MLRGNLFRIYPKKDQKIILNNHFGSCRFIFNKFLHIRETLYNKFKASISKNKLDEHLVVLKELYPWLKEVNSQSLQQVNKDLENAFDRFFKGLGKYPTKKSKKNHNYSFQVPQHYKVNIEKSEIFLPKIGWIKIKFHRKFLDEYYCTGIVEKDSIPEILRTLTVSKTPTGKYYVSILTDDQINYPPIQEFSHATMIGVDVGIKSFAALSNGEIIEHPKFLKSSLQRLKCLQKRVSRKVIGSNNRRKAVKKLAVIHEKISNQRHDFQHKVSKKLISENQAIAVETLNVKGMMKNHKLAQAIGDSAWYSFVLKLSYKAEQFGKTLLKINQWEPSSKTCNICGYHNSELTLIDRNWLCPDCGTNHDRDINAAINIKKFALITAGTVGRACGLALKREGNEAGSPSFQ